jgi:hypothetical protein
MRRWPIYLMVLFCPFKAPAQDTRAGVRTDGFYAYSWKGKDFWPARQPNCDSITSPDVFFTRLPLFFFYTDSTVVYIREDDYKAATDAPLTAAYFQKNQTRLSSYLRNKVIRQSQGAFGMVHRHDDTLMAKMRYFEYSWNKSPAWYRITVKSPDTLLITEFDCSFCVYCIVPEFKAPVIKFDPPVILTFYPFPVKPDSSWAGFDKRRWLRKP